MRSLTRQFWVVAHRWAGLTIALFLVVAGATGIILPWEEELTRLSAPSAAYAAPPTPGAKPLDGVEMARRVERQTGGRVTFVPLDVPRDHSVRVAVAPRAEQPALGYDTVWADPYTGAVRIKFRYAVLADGAQNIVPFLYQVHYSFAAGYWGNLAFGIAALVWVIDCFVGFYVTLPMRQKLPGKPLQSWWQRWRPAWTVRRPLKGHKRNMDLHRAGGLWLWPLLLVFAWSSVGFNLPEVHRPIMRALGASADFKPADLPVPLEAPKLDVAAARDVGRRLIAGEAARRGFTVEREGYLFYRPAWGMYGYGVRTSADPSHEDPGTRVWFGGDDGRLTYFQGPLGENGTDATMRWFYLLHMAQVFGLPYRIFVSLLGLGVVVLSVTGVLIWMKKRAARLLGKRRRRPEAVPMGGLVAAE